VFVPLMAFVPPMVMGKAAAGALPLTDVILSADVVRRNPVRARVRRPCPVAVVPRVVRSLRILVALDPHIVRAGLRRHAVSAWGRRRTDVNVKSHLRVGRGGREEECRDSECPKIFSHEETVG
jgi:hypothetical protein